MGSTIKTPIDQPGPITGWVTTGYFSSTKTATYGFLAALPLLAMYEALILLVNGDQLAQVRVGADIWIKQTLALIGVYGVYAIGLVVLVVGIFVFVRERSKKIPLKKVGYFCQKKTKKRQRKELGKLKKKYLRMTAKKGPNTRALNPISNIKF